MPLRAGRLIRPQSRYIGPVERTWGPLDAQG